MQSYTIILLLGVVALASAANLSEEDGAWEFFKSTHEKVYSTNTEEQFRRSLFEKNVEEVKQHNMKFLSGLESYSMAVNQFSDMMLDEVIGGGLLTPEYTNEESFYVPNENIAVPDSIDWRKNKGVVTPVKNQGRCGSCWAFSATGSLEGQVMLKENKSVSLSEQQLVDCDPRSNGCGGGLMVNAYQYISTHGIETETDYPYHARNQACKYDASKVVAKNRGYTRIPKENESALKSAIANVGPIAVAVGVNGNFMHYHGGVLDDPTCHVRLNHGVLAVGYGSDSASGKDYYIVKNSWGAGWGESGYIRLVQNKNMCGISLDACYPTM